MFSDAELGSDAWLDRLGRAARALGSRRFEEELLALLNEVLPVDLCVVFTHSVDGLGHLFTHGKLPPERAEELANDYVRQYHDRDPLYPKLAAVAAGEELEAPRPLDMPTDYDPAYRSRFFDRVGLVDKTSIVGRIEADSVLCNFYRMTGSGPYSTEERRRLDRILPLVAALIAAHHRLAKNVAADAGREAAAAGAGAPPPGAGAGAAVDGAPDAAPGGHARTRSLVRTVIGTRVPPFDQLTARELEVCERILLGYTSIGIGLDLDIALSSVLTYRKRAYQKLGIGTQAQLFALCLAAAKR
jgi:DNA-binding CsgD family transcriptional regulator